LDERPTFRAVRDCFERDHKITLVHGKPFKNDDLTVKQFRRDGKECSSSVR